MQANKHALGDILSQEVRLLAPLFQRPYVWKEQENWFPLWQALEELLARRLAGEQQRGYFLGALVFDQIPTATGLVAARQMIDGQQRMTTLQILFRAASDVFGAFEGLQHEVKQLKRLMFNELEHESEELFKVWPTNIDRSNFRRVMQGTGGTGLLAECYGYFQSRLAEWINQDPPAQKERAAAFVQAARYDLVFVVIDLDNDDDGQLIFETLNALGTPLQPSDLVKNLLFREAVALKLNTQELYSRYWQPFDQESTYWRAELSVGRLKRPRLEVFLQFYLTLRRAKEPLQTHLFRDFREEFKSGHLGDVVETLGDFSRLAQIYKMVDRLKPEDSGGVLREVMTVFDTSALMPAFLGTVSNVEDTAERSKMFDILESYLVRRQICSVPAKNLNNVAVELVQTLNSRGWTKETMHGALIRYSSYSTEWPSDQRVIAACTSKPAYGYVKRERLAYILGRVEQNMRSKKSELAALDGTIRLLTIEHIMPRSWMTHWPLPEDSSEEQARMRHEIVDHLGNLTVLTGSLNSEISNGPWETKRKSLNQHTVLLMNSRLAGNDIWNEEKITNRSRELAQAFCEIWPK